jgi:thiamine-phosphate pyrophosphorylase
MDAYILRIIDANLNRLTEGLRVAEEYTRFVLTDAILSSSLKDIRHKALNIITPDQRKEMMKQRDSINDPGADEDETRNRRKTTEEVAGVNLKRSAEALRVLEEYIKTIDAGKAAEFKELRFKVYEIEKRFALPLKKLYESSLYIIITESLCKHPFEETVKMVLDGGADIIQIREKEKDAKDISVSAEGVRKIMKEYDALLVVNDRPDIARAVHADGVHVGQEDMTVSQARRIFPGGLIGKSTHSAEQAGAAQKEEADYIGIGPVFTTGTKQGAEPIGIETAIEMSMKAEIPGFAIGGITRDSCKEILEAGFTRAAICSAVIGAENPRKEAEYFKSLLRGNQE